MMLLRFVVIAGVLVAIGVGTPARALDSVSEAAIAPLALSSEVLEKKKSDTPPRPRPKPGPKDGGEDE